MTPPAVSLHHVSKCFGDVVAVDDASLDVAVGEIHAVLGENGAGKTSLMNILAGLYRPDRGEILLRGERAEIHSPQDAKRYRIGMVHQEQRLVTRFTAPENVSLGHREPRFLTLRRYFRRLARYLSERYYLPIDDRTLVMDLPLGRRQRVELVKLLHHGAEIIILDEPTGNLAPAEVETFFRSIRQLVDGGRTVILITHKLDEVLRYADCVTVMRAGRVVATFPADEAGRAEVNRLMVGRDEFRVPGLTFQDEELPAPRPHETWNLKPGTQFSAPVLEIEHLTAGDPSERHSLKDVSLRVRGGEVVAVAGVAGNGQTLLAEAVSGLLTDYDGCIRIGGRDIRGLSSRGVASLGLAYVPENRKEVGLILSQSVALNLALRSFDRPPFSHSGWIDERALRAEAERLIERYRIQAASPDTPVGRLSGGNQQRVVVARELSGQPRLILVDNFLRGLDARSTQQFKGELFAHRDRGAAAVWITGDLSEAMECDRIAVIQQGRIVGLLAQAEASREALGLLMSGDDGPGQRREASRRGG